MSEADRIVSYKIVLVTSRDDFVIYLAFTS